MKRGEGEREGEGRVMVWEVEEDSVMKREEEGDRRGREGDFDEEGENIGRKR